VGIVVVTVVPPPDVDVTVVLCTGMAARSFSPSTKNGRYISENASAIQPSASVTGRTHRRQRIESTPAQMKKTAAAT
jgi:hypothetical protein